MEDFFKNFRSFLGLPRFNGHNYPQDDERAPNDDSRYDAFADPSEMHRYFEHQMEKILRNFDIFQFGNSDPFFGEFDSNDGIEFFDQHVLPPIEDRQGAELRDQFLKPGYERPVKHLEKADKDLDENRISIGDLDSVVAGNFFKNKDEQPKITTKFFGKSMSTKTVMNPDGSMEIHKTIRDNQGNEETTVTRRIGDKEHTVTKKKDSSGKEQIIENLVNIDESDTLLSEHKPWSLYDKFFK